MAKEQEAIKDFDAPDFDHNKNDGLVLSASTAPLSTLDLLSDSSSESGSGISVSSAFAEPPSLGDIGEDLSEFSDMELTFDGPREWTEAEMALICAQPHTKLNALTTTATASLLDNTAAKLLLCQGDNADLSSVDLHTQARLEALLEAAGIGKLSTTDGKAFADPEVLRKLTSSVSCALDEAAAALTRMRAEPLPPPINEKTLAEACSDGDIEAVKKLLNEGRSVHETNDDGESLLSLACASGFFELAEVLLRMKANVEDRGIKGDCTPLMEASSQGHLQVVLLLLKHGADVNAQSSAGHTALHHAAVGGHGEVVKELIKSGANVEEQNENGHTPLMEAASAGHVRVAEILLNAGAGINTHSNEFKESALTLACYKGHLGMVKFLLDAGADQEHKTDEMHTALMEASMDGHVEVAKLLLDSGAQVNMPADSFESPLTLAACGGHVKLACLLITRGANLEEVNDEGYTPLMEASREGHEEMVSTLLSNNANVNAQTEETQETALTLACCGGFIEVAQSLIVSGADIERGCSTPLMEASQEGHLDLVRFLIQKGSNINALTGTNDSALTYASENGHTEVVEVLLQHGAQLEHESEGGRTPLMKAARAGHFCTVQFLIASGADVNRSTANNEHTVLSLACAGGHMKVVELLLQHNADPLHKLKDGSTMLIEASKGGHSNVVNTLLKYPHNKQKGLSATLSSEYADSIPMADNLPPDAELPSSLDISQKSTESLAGRLEQFIHKMMSQAENSSGTREEQMARKQEILEELQRVEQELKYRTQRAQENQQSLTSSALVDPLAAVGAPIHPISTSINTADAVPPSTPGINLNQEFMEQAERQKQHEAQLQQQKEYYQTKLQLLKQQYQQKQLQLQHQRQQLLSQATSNAACTSLASLPDSGMRSSGDGENRQPIPLHIALQNHLHAHHVTEGNVDDLAQALQQWENRDRTNVNITASPVKPMPSFNLNSKYEEIADESLENCVGDLPLRLEDLTFNETPPSRSLADSLSALIQEKVLDDAKIQRDSDECDVLTMKTLQWLQTVDAQFADKAAKLHDNEGMSPPVDAFPIDIPDQQLNTINITKVLNGYSPQSTPASSIAPVSLVDSQYTIVDPNAVTDTNHDTALTLACAGGHGELVRILLAHQAHIEHRDKKGFTPLILAATAGHAEVVEILLDNNAEIEAQSERTKDTPLSLACSGGRYEVVEILLRRMANKEHRNVSDYTPLSLAASGGYVPIIKLLLDYHAEINSRTGSKLGISPLMLAAMNGHTSAVRVLLDHGSDINAQIETNRNTALTLACFQGRHDVVNLLVDRKANIEHRAKTGLTPLMEAASGGYVEVGRVLLDKAADVNASPVPSSKDTALTIAADKGHYRFVELLLSRGAFVDVKNKKGNSPLWLACNGGHLDVVQLLVSHKADIDGQDNRRVSSLMAAFRKGHVKVVKWLVQHVTQFPSDQECARYITSVSDKDLLKKCQQCMDVIVQAKEQQGREASKNANILLKQIETEKSREEKRKEAAARKREKKKQKRKERQAEQNLEKNSLELGDGDKASSASPRDTSLSPSEPKTPPCEILSQEHQADDQTEHAVMQSIQKRANMAVNEMKKKSNAKLLRGGGKENVTKRNQRNKETALHKDTKVEQGELEIGTELFKSPTRIAELDDFSDPPPSSNGKQKSARHAAVKREHCSSGIHQLDSFDGNYVKYSPTKSYSNKSAAYPSPGKKKKDETVSDWKQVTNKKSKRVAVPHKVVPQLNKCLNSIREKSGAQIQFEKAEKKSSERTLAIRGSMDSIRTAHNEVCVLIRKEVGSAETDLHVYSSKKGHISDTQASQQPSHSSSSSVSSTTSSAASTTNQLNSNRDSMSNMGNFNLADYLPTHQPQAEAKVKYPLSKPGWPVRPSAGQSVWKLQPSPTQQSIVAVTGQRTPVRTPVSRALASPADQMPFSNDASRQLFSEPRKTPGRDSKFSSMTTFADLAPHPLLPEENQPLSTSEMRMSPSIERSQFIHPMEKMSGNQMMARRSVPVMANNVPVPYALQQPVYTTAEPVRPLMSSKTHLQAYSPFEGQGSKVPQTFNRQPPSFVGSADPTKAPGFRPSPVLLSQFSTHPMPVEESFSRAPGSRPVANSDQHISPRSVNSSGLAIFSDHVVGGQHPVSHAPPYGYQTKMMDQRNAMPIAREHYSTTGEPMTLPRISSDLNPHASEFSVPMKYGSEAAPQSPHAATSFQASPQSASIQFSHSMSTGQKPLYTHPSPEQGKLRQLGILPSSQNSQVSRIQSLGINQGHSASVHGMHSPSSISNPRSVNTPNDASLSSSSSSEIFGQPAIFQPNTNARIWASNEPNKSQEDDWKMRSTTNPSAKSFSEGYTMFFNTDGGSSAEVVTPNQFYMGSMPGAAGDGLQNAWTNTVGKGAPSNLEWSSWKQPKTE